MIDNEEKDVFEKISSLTPIDLGIQDMVKINFNKE